LNARRSSVGPALRPHTESPDDVDFAKLGIGFFGARHGKFYSLHRRDDPSRVGAFAMSKLPESHGRQVRTFFLPNDSQWQRLIRERPIASWNRPPAATERRLIDFSRYTEDQ
jgi:hypothetical protein